MRRVATIYKKHLGPMHPWVGKAIFALVEILVRTNRLAEAEPHMRHVLAILRARRPHMLHDRSFSDGTFDPDAERHYERELNELVQLYEDTNRRAEIVPLMGRLITFAAEKTTVQLAARKHDHGVDPNLEEKEKEECEKAVRGLDEPLTLTAFAPKTVRPAARVLVQAFIHLPTQIETVRVSAGASDAASRPAGYLPLRRTRVDDRIRVRLDPDSLKADEDIQELVWGGAPVAVAFSLRIPRFRWRTDYHLKLLVEINDTPAGRLTFVLRVDRKAPRLSDVAELTAYDRFSFVFMSYASEDRAHVMTRAQAYDAAGVHYFLDVESLRAGQDWEAELKKHVGRSDVFILFWSPEARASKWVAQEACWALELRQRSPTAKPIIKPYQVHPERRAEPPPQLRDIHFEDLKK